MRLDDLCLVNTDVTRSDDFYREEVGLTRRMRNERFVDFVLGDGPRLALWIRPSIAETVGATYPTREGSPFRITLDFGAQKGPRDPEISSDRPTESGPGVFPFRLVDPDGFVTAIRPPDEASAGVSAPDGPRIVAVDLAVGDLAESCRFLETLGFPQFEPSADQTPGSARFDAGLTVLTLVDEGLISTDDLSWSRSGGHLMLAIELDTGEAVDAAHAALSARGLAASGDPAVYEWGARSIYFVDPDAFIWEIYAWVEEPR